MTSWRGTIGKAAFVPRRAYYEACKRFCAYLAAEYHLQKLENISGKHLVSYVLYLQDNGKSASTVKNRPCRHSFLPR